MPSARIAQISEPAGLLLPVAFFECMIHAPSGDHAGYQFTAPSLSTVVTAPVANVSTWILHPLPEAMENAIRVPSGDQSGCAPWGAARDRTEG